MEEESQAPQAPRSAERAEGPIDVTPSPAVAEGRQSPGLLSARLRPDVECAPWVIEEVRKLESALAAPGAPQGGLAGQIMEVLVRLDSGKLSYAQGIHEISELVAAAPSQEEGPAGVDADIEAVRREIYKSDPVAMSALDRLAARLRGPVRLASGLSLDEELRAILAGLRPGASTPERVQAHSLAVEHAARLRAQAPASSPRDLEAGPKYATTTQEWEARLNAKFLDGVHDILVWSGCYTGDCPHHDQKECDAHVLEVGKQVAVEFLQDAAPMPHEAAQPPEATPIEAAGLEIPKLEALIAEANIQAITRPQDEHFYGILIGAVTKMAAYIKSLPAPGTAIEKAARAVELAAMLGRANYVTHPHHEWLSITNRADDTYVTVQLPGIIAKEIAFRINSFEALSGLPQEPIPAAPTFWVCLDKARLSPTLETAHFWLDKAHAEANRTSPQEGAAGEGGSILDGGPIAPPAPTSGEAQEPKEGGAA